MELKLKLSFNQLLKLIYQLPEGDQEKLAEKLHSELSSKKSENRKAIQDFILAAPTWTKEQLLEYNEAKMHLNKSRLI